MMDNGWAWGMGFGWIWFFVFVGVIVWAVLRLTERGGERQGPRASGEPSAQEILARRYARGELSDEQYESMRRRLSPSPNILGDSSNNP